MDEQINRKLLDFIAASPTAWHAVENLSLRLRAEGYRELYEQAPWKALPGGKYFVRRNGSALLAFRLPTESLQGFRLMAAHADSPSFKIKENAAVPTGGLYTRLNVEGYGGMISSSWLDRPLSVAGRVAVRTEAGVELRLVNVQRDLLLIPNLAIHMDRSINESKRWDPNTDMLPLFGDAEQAEEFARLIAGEAGCAPEDLLATELLLYPRTPGCIWGAAGEYISSPRLDDLQCVFACADGFLQSGDSDCVPMLCVFDNEEVGSATRQGADADFLERTLERIADVLGLSEEDYACCLAGSFLVSADNAHAVHPNHPEFSDRNDRPTMNRGVVIKWNAAQRYTSDALSAAVFAEICRRAEVPVQRYSNRADLPGGSTLGNLSTRHVALCAVDIGLAQLAMHSAYETAGARDTALLIRAAKAYYETRLCRQGEGFVLLP